jgi:hypothetical protein
MLLGEREGRRRQGKGGATRSRFSPPVGRRRRMRAGEREVGFCSPAGGWTGLPKFRSPAGCGTGVYVGGQTTQKNSLRIAGKGVGADQIPDPADIFSHTSFLVYPCYLSISHMASTLHVALDRMCIWTSEPTYQCVALSYQL